MDDLHELEVIIVLFVVVLALTTAAHRLLIPYPILLVIGGLLGNQVGGGSGRKVATAAGAVAGGVIGNQFGSGHGRDAATVAGAALGYSVARDEQRRNDRYYGRYSERVVRTEEERCRIETDYREEERVLGYDVAYRYNGRVYHTRTDSHPGDTIRVRVDVEAVN